MARGNHCSLAFGRLTAILVPPSEDAIALRLQGQHFLLGGSSQVPSWVGDTSKKTSMTRLFKSAAGRGLTSSRYARLGQAPTGDLQKRRYTNGSSGSTGNFANFSQAADWNSQNGNVTTMGTNGGASAYAQGDCAKLGNLA